MALDPETRQRLLELYYDLLPEEEAAELRRRLEAEPELARAYAETEKFAGVLAQAARLEEPKLVLKRPDAGAVAVAPVVAGLSPKRAAARARLAARTIDPQGKRRYRAATWIVALAAGILLLISLGGVYYHHGQLADIAADHLRLRVVGPARLEPGVASRYSVVTSSLTGTPVASQVELTLSAPDGHALLAHTERTRDDGHLEIVLPANLPLEREARLEIKASADGKTEAMTARLDIVGAREATALALDKRQVRPGETLGYRSLTLSSFGLASGTADADAL